MSETIEQPDLFVTGTQNDIMHRILLQASARNAEGRGKKFPAIPTKADVYVFLEETPMTSLIVHLMDAAAELNYKIVQQP